ncbi:MAG: site-2 protease family protein [Candidatus Promineofilum sp.]|nr:site-2 protease family protein [Promineifilum sp.]MCW5863819.1 site-2 protease family protein [Anaerolineae bacterium]
MLNLPDVSIIIARVVVLIIAFTVHELSHAVTADYLGDPTPRRMGRITLNPLKHLDPIGTLLLIIAGFGWAKPVMINPMNMRGNPRTSMAIVAAAGPISNLLMAAIAAVFFRLGLVSFVQSSGAFSLSLLMSEFIWINLILAFFNLIPIPPLDGSKILYAILPSELVYRLRPLEQFGFLILMAVVFFVPAVLNVLVGLPAVALLQLLIGGSSLGL